MPYLISWKHFPPKRHVLIAKLTSILALAACFLPPSLPSSLPPFLPFFFSFLPPGNWTQGLFTAELHSQVFSFFIFRQGVAKLVRVALILWSFCLSFQNLWDYTHLPLHLAPNSVFIDQFKTQQTLKYLIYYGIGFLKVSPQCLSKI